MSVVGAS